MTRRTRVTLSSRLSDGVGLGPRHQAARAATTVVNGVIVSDESFSPSPTAVAVVTLVDQTADRAAGRSSGQQRIDGPSPPSIAFEVLYDDAAIDPTHSYALFATIVDGVPAWNSETPVPVITGGPKSNVELPVVPAPDPAATSTVG